METGIASRNSLCFLFGEWVDFGWGLMLKLVFRKEGLEEGIKIHTAINIEESMRRLKIHDMP